MAEIDDILLKNWGYASFRPLQREIVSSVLEGKDTLALLPTGGGKSVCFQVPALAKPGLCLVISPLIALMNDQVQNLERKGIRAMAITSSMTRPEINRAFANAIYGDYKFLYVSPERLHTDLFRKKVEGLNISLIAVDEAHCISQWGYDFRPSYLDVVRLREYLPGVPVIAVTASATKEVVADIAEKLHFKNHNTFRASFARKNLHYIVQHEENKFERLVRICTNIPGTGVVYVRNRKKTMEIASFLLSNQISADYYHAGLDAGIRAKKQLDWIDNKTRVIVSTNAFGMGIDKPDVRFVVHMDLPDSLEAYFQEAGRGGRDEKQAYAIALVQSVDILQLEQNLETSFPEIDQIRQVYQAVANYYQIAVGAGEGLAVEFNMEEISSKYNLKPTLIFNSLKFLEKEGYLSLLDVSFESSKVLIRAGKEELYNFQVRNAKFDNLIKTLLRSYGGIMDTYVPISENKLSSRLNISADVIVKDLRKLHELEIVDYVPQSQRPRLIFTENRIPNKELSLSKENYKMLKQRAKERVDSVISYVNENQVCRNRKLLVYFGEDHFEDCGHCDICLDRKRKLRGEDLEEIKKQISLLLQQRTYRLDDVVSSLYRFNKDKVVDALNEMLDDDVLVKNDKQYLSLNTY